MSHFEPGDVVTRIFSNFGGHRANDGVEHVVLSNIGGEVRFVGNPGQSYSANKYALVRKALDLKALPLTEAPAPVGNVTGRKDDSGKPDMTLLDDMPRALLAVVEVMQWAIEKKQPVPYVRGSWLGVHPDRYSAAVGRHRIGAALQASRVVGGLPRLERDGETKLLHAAHEATSALMKLELTLRELERAANE